MEGWEFSCSSWREKGWLFRLESISWKKKVNFRLNLVLRQNVNGPKLKFTQQRVESNNIEKLKLCYHIALKKKNIRRNIEIFPSIHDCVILCSFHSSWISNILCFYVWFWFSLVPALRLRPYLSYTVAPYILSVCKANSKNKIMVHAKC